MATTVPAVAEAATDCRPKREERAQDGWLFLELCGTGRRDPDGVVVNTIHPEPEIHEHIYMTKRLRNIVYNCMHIFNNAEHNVNNCVNGTTHTDEMTVQQ